MCLAIPGKILSIDATLSELLRTAKVSFGGIVKDVNLSMTPDAQVDDYVLVHVGVSIGVIDEAEAHETLHYLRQMGELDELEAADPPSG